MFRYTTCYICSGPVFQCEFSSDICFIIRLTKCGDFQIWKYITLKTGPGHITCSISFRFKYVHIICASPAQTSHTLIYNYIQVMKIMNNLSSLAHKKKLSIVTVDVYRSCLVILTKIHSTQDEIQPLRLDNVWFATNSPYF